MWSLCFGFLGLIMPWSAASFNILSVGSSMGIHLGQPLSFWQTSLFALAFRQAPCRAWIVTQTTTPQGNILNFVQTAGFSVLFVLVLLWFAFLWVNRKVLTQAQRKQVLQTSLFLIVVSTLIVVRMATFADCSLIKSIELVDAQFFWTSLLFPTFAIIYGILAIIKSRSMSKEVVSD